MMNSEGLNLLILKTNVKSISLLISLVLIASGIFMCFQQIAHDGFIDIKSTFLSGKVQSGSLGLLVIFLGVAIILTVVKKSGLMSERKGERIELEIGNKRIICVNLSFRKVQEIRELLKETDNADSRIPRKSN